MSDLVQRLRSGTFDEYSGDEDLKLEAADEIERLTGELDEARRVHQEWFNGPDGVRWYMAEIERLTRELEVEKMCHTSASSTLHDMRKERDRLTRERDRELEHSHALTQNWANALEEIDRLRAELEWYAEHASSVARYLQAKPVQTDAVMAVVTTLSLDEGKRAREALRGEK